MEKAVTSEEPARCLVVLDDRNTLIFTFQGNAGLKTKSEFLSGPDYCQTSLIKCSAKCFSYLN